VALFDLPHAQLQNVTCAEPEPAGLDAFWSETLAQTRAAGGDVTVDGKEIGLMLDIHDVTFPGFMGQPVKAWLVRPRGTHASLPVVIEYPGYSSGRGLAHQWLLWACAGYAHLVMDIRGQGNGINGGDTDDADDLHAGPGGWGFLTRGILSPYTSYYRRLITDAVRAVDALERLPGCDTSRVMVTGISQGGGLALNVAALLPDRINGVTAGLPFLCHIGRAVTITDRDPYHEVVRYCRANPHRASQALHTLSFMDAAHLVKRAKAPAVFSVALMDDVCPPSTVYAAYNGYAGPKDIAVYEWENHDQHSADWQLRCLAFADRVLRH
jgi:cephalosporin-C deacetylase